MAPTVLLLDPSRVPGRWLVTTSSGARHLVESTPGPLWTITVTRMTATASAAGHPYARLRRDGDPLRVAAIEHRVEGAARSGIRVGEDMYLILEPLGPRAMLTVRRTTPVVRIDPEAGTTT